MIYKFNVILFELSGTQVEVEIDGQHTFMRLHETLQKALGIPSCLMASFFISDPLGRHRFEVSQVEIGQGKAPCSFMRRTRISDLISPQTPVIQYTFDFINDRTMNMELTGINMEKNLKEPKVKINGTEARVQLLDEVIGDDFSTEVERNDSDSAYGVVDDYFEIFGEIEELTN